MKSPRDNVRTYFKEVDMPGGYAFDTAETLRTIDLYYEGKYKTGQYDAKGFRKFFYNIVKPTTDIASKFIDLDTKDIVLVPTTASDELRVWLMQRRLKQWLKDTKFGVLLNEITDTLPKYGHVVIKKVNRKWEMVPLENLRLNPGVRWLKDSSFVYEVHKMSKSQMSDRWNGDMSDIEEDRDYIIYECYDKKGDKWLRTIRTDLFEKKNGNIETAESQLNDENEYMPSKVLDEREVDFPYRELKWEEVRGRWLGKGFVEYLEDNQIAINEAENLERKGLMFTSLKLYQTRDQNIGGSNVLTDAENGDIFTITDEVTPVAVEERNLPAFNNTRANWTENTVKKTFTSDITSGENLPSRTPLGVANLQASLATSYFELKREKYGLFIKELISEDVIPDFKRDNRKEHILTFLGSEEEIEIVNKAIINSLVDKAVVDHAMKTGFFPSQLMREDARARVESKLNSQRNRYMKIPDGYYENANYFVDVLVTGESQDVGAQGQVLNLALQALQGNPAILQNKTTRAVFFRLLSLSGISPADLSLLQENVDQTPIPQGGSIGQPQVGPSPQGINQVV